MFGSRIFRLPASSSSSWTRSFPTSFPDFTNLSKRTLVISSASSSPSFQYHQQRPRPNVTRKVITNLVFGVSSCPCQNQNGSRRNCSSSSKSSTATATATRTSSSLKVIAKKDDEEDEEEEEKKKKKGPKREDFSLPVTKDFFSSVKAKNKETFITALEVFQVRDKNARGHVEFIYAALKNMKHFGVHRDLETYKKILDVFPKGRFVAQNMFQVEFQHYPKQQDCAVDVLDQMEDMGVMPDTETQILLTNIFGSYAFPLRKLMRMMYWMPKFKNLSPWPIPDPLPDDGLELAKIAIQRITSVDLKTQITCFKTEDLDDATDHTWIVSGQSPQQMKLIEQHPGDRPIYVEGAFRVWISRTCINYFILRAEPRDIPKPKEKDPDDVGVMTSIFQEDFIAKEVAHVRSVHEQDDGDILAICATGTSSRDSLISWLRFLEESNPRLAKDISILITLKSPLGPTDDLELEEIPERKDKIQPQIGEDPAKFMTTKEQEEKDGKKRKEVKIGFDPTGPELDQVGIRELSDTKFLNWPHDFNPKTIEIRRRKRLQLQEEPKVTDEETKSIT